MGGVYDPMELHLCDAFLGDIKVEVGEYDSGDEDRVLLVMRVGKKCVPIIELNDHEQIIKVVSDGNISVETTDRTIIIPIDIDPVST